MKELLSYDFRKQIEDVKQRSSTFLPSGTGFMEDNFSTDWGWVGNGSGGDASDWEPWGAVGSGGEPWGAVRSRAEPWGVADEALLAHLLLCSPALNRPWTGTGTWSGVWGPLM